MTNKVVLNNVDHAGLRVALRHGAEFGDAVNQMLILPTEFEEAQREYPIFFRKDANDEYQAVVLLGLDRDENLFLNEGGWKTRYVPAVQARGPFSIVLQEQSHGGELRREPMIHVDLDDPRVGGDEGEPLFLPHGGNAPCLEHVAEVLRTLYAGLEIARPLFRALEAPGLIRPVSVEIKLDDARQYDLPGLHTVDRDALARLDGAELEQLHRAGYLRLAFLAASSIANVNRLIELKNRKNGP